MQLHNPLCEIINGLLLHVVWPFKIFTVALLTHHCLVSQQIETTQSK
jgi:hypothetical protein